jgi:hypothetical protein
LVSNETKMGLFIFTGKSTLHAHRTGLFRPTTALTVDFTSPHFTDVKFRCYKLFVD